MILSKELLQYENAFDVTKQIVSEKLQGIYFLNQEKLSFYSFASGNHYVAHTFPGCDSAYVAKDMLYILSENVCYTYDLNTQSLKSEFKVVGYQTTAVGADPKGRIYIAASRFDNPDTNEILLFSPEGKKLSEMKVGTDVYEFLGFDSGNGRFYMESYQKCYSLNKGRDGRGLTMGQVTGNSLKYIDTHYEFLENGVGPIDMSCILCLCEEESLKQIGSG